MQNSTNMRILELLRFLYERTDENHPATVSDIIAHLNGKGIQAVRQTVYADTNALIDAGIDIVVVDMFTSESSKEVTLLCENELMRVIIDHYGEDAAVDRYDDTHFTAKIEVNPSGTFYGWIFKFKGKIKILSPKECITEMQQIAQEFI
jgi:hypothetical protein